MPKTLEEYLSLPYTFVLRRDVRDNLFVARVEELPGCSAHGDTEEEALSNLRDNMRVWIQDCIDSGDQIPTPAERTEMPSGKWLQRVPRSLHLKLIRLAKEEGVSLNQLVTSALAESAGSKSIRIQPLPNLSAGSQWVYGCDAWASCVNMGDGFEIQNKVSVRGMLTDASEAYLGVLAGAKAHGSPHRERRLHAEDDEQALAYR